MKNGTGSLINVLKYLMLLVLAGYIFFILSTGETSGTSFETIEGSLVQATKNCEMIRGDEKLLKRYYGLNAKEYEECLYFYPSATMSVDELLLIRISDDQQADGVERAMEKRVETQKRNFEGYGAEQTKVLSDAVIEMKGRYLIFISSSDAGEIYRAFTDCL